MFGWGARRGGGAGADTEHVLPTKVLGRFLEAMSRHEAPVLVDLGAVVGSNVGFLGERLGCKLLVEDVYSDVERYAREGKSAELAAAFEHRFAHADGSIDGILCWDVFDYMDKGAARALGAHLERMLRPGGALVAFFATVKPEGEPHFTRYVIKDEKTLAHRPYAASRVPQQVLTNRDIQLLFPKLKVSDSFLLLSRTREMLLRK